MCSEPPAAWPRRWATSAGARRPSRLTEKRQRPIVEAQASVEYAAPVANYSLAAIALSEVRTALAAGDTETALEWLQTLPPAQRPPDLVVACADARAGTAASELDARSRAAASEGNWTRAEQLAAEAVSTISTPWRQERLGLLRRRQPLQDDQKWRRLSHAVPPATRLLTGAFRPELDAVAACSAYFSRGRGSSNPWVKYLRLSKAPPKEDEERRAVFSLAAGYLSWFVANKTDLLKVAETVVPVPANPVRYADRMASLPDELARGVERHLSLRLLPNAIAWVPEMTNVKMQQLSRAERPRLSRLMFRPGNQADRVADRGVLLVDDITTSGSTLRACARVLREAGASHVVACCLAHTEG